MKKYLRSSFVAMQKHLIYRVRMFNWMLVDISHVLIFPFLWLSLYQGNTTIGGLTRADIVTYYIVTIFIGMCTNAHNSVYIQEDIVTGKLSTMLVKPIQYIFYRYMLENGYRILIAPSFFVLLFLSSFFLSDYIQLPSSLFTFFIFLFFLLCSHIIFACIELLIGLSSFYFQETKAFSFLRSILEKLLGGAFAPLTFLPALVQTAAHFLPFQYLFFVPTQIYLGKITGEAILQHAAIAMAWIGFLFLCITVLWKRGLRHYDGGSV